MAARRDRGVRFAAWAALALAGTARAAEDPAEGRLLDALRARGLEQLSDALVRKRLDDPNLTGAARAEAAFALAAAFEEQGNAQLDAAARRAAWASTDRLLTPFLKAGPEDELGRFEFRLRWALLIRERGRFAHELHRAIPEDAELAADALAHAETAAATLGELAKVLRERLEQIVGGNRERFQRLASLSLRADLEAGTAWTLAVKARAEPAGKATAAVEAENLLAKRAEEFAADPLTMESFLQLADCFRARGRFAEARKKLATFDEHPEAPPAYRDRALLLAARTDLEAGEVSSALRRLEVPADKAPKPTGEWRCLHFEALLRSPSAAGARDRQEDAMALLDVIERSEPKYWQLRCEQVLREHGKPEAIGNNPTALRRVARLRRDAKDWAEAFAQYDRAIARAEARGQGELAGRIGLEAAEAAELQGDHASAGRRRLAAAARLPDPAAQAEARLAGAEALLRGAPNDAAALASAGQAVAAALAGGTLAPARRHDAEWLRGSLAERAGDANAAVQAYNGVPPGHPRYAAASDALASIAYNAWLADGGKLPAPERLDAALAEFAQRVGHLSKLSGPEAARARALSQWLACRLLAARDPARIPEALRLATAEVLPSPALPAALRNAALRQCLDWQFAQGDAAGARAAAAAWQKTDAAGAAKFLLTRSPLDPDLPPPMRAARAAAALAAAEGDGAELRVERRLLRASADAAGNRFPEAFRLLKALRDEAPRDLRVAVAAARVKELANDLPGATADWELLARGLRRGTSAWLDAVFENARLLAKAGKKSEAKKLVAFALDGYRKASKPETLAKLEALSKELSAP